MTVQKTTGDLQAQLVSQSRALVAQKDEINRHKETIARHEAHVETLKSALADKDSELQDLQAQFADLGMSHADLQYKLEEIDEANRTAIITPEQLADSHYLMSLGFKDPSKAIQEGRLKVVSPTKRGVAPSVVITNSQLNNPSFVRQYKITPERIASGEIKVIADW